MIRWCGVVGLAGIVAAAILLASGQPALRPDGLRSAEAPAVEGAAERSGDAFAEQVGRIVAAVTRAAEENARRPRASGGSGRLPRGVDSGERRLEGDALADYYIRRAAQAALAETEGEPARAFLVAVGVALDDTGMLVGHPLVKLVLKDVESRHERRARLKVLGEPTLRGRHDWLLHFVVSASLAGLGPPTVAEAAGLHKELADAQAMERGGGSGFSFADLAADYAGLELAAAFPAELEKARPILRAIAAGFEGDRFLPDLRDAEEGLTYTALVDKYGTTTDARFQAALRRLREAVRATPGWKQLREVAVSRQRPVPRR